MSRLLGIINPSADPTSLDYWIWRATELPNDPAWDYERLNVEQFPVDGNIQYRVLGGATPRFPDGVFLKLQVNPALNPQLKLSGEGVSVPAPLPLTPVQPVDAPSPSVATPERLEGESQPQVMRRK